MEFVISSFFSNLLSFVEGNWDKFIPELNWLGKIVQAMYNWIGNYGWTVVVFTIFLKILTTPLDIWQRVVTKKSSVKTAEMQPLLDKIDKQYAGNQQRINEEKQKVYKKQGVSALSSCLPLIVTMAVFIIMFSGLNSYSAYINVKNYADLDVVYGQSYDSAIAEGNDEDAAIKLAQTAVGRYYNDNIKESFLWIHNVWRPDTWQSIMADANSFQKGGMGLKAISPDAPFEKARYNSIMEGVISVNPGYFASYDDEGNIAIKNGTLQGGWNGLIILPLISVGLAFLSSWITQLQAKGKNKETNPNDPNQQSAKMMMWLMPIMLGVFGFLYTAAFCIYMVSNSFLSIISTVALNGTINKMAEKSIAKKKIEKGEEKASYMR